MIIEYFGLAGDPQYDRDSAAKRDYWKQRPDWTFIEFTDITSRGADTGAALLLDRLARAGVTGTRLSDEEIWSRMEAPDFFV